MPDTEFGQPASGTAVRLREMANPTPIGVAGFALTVFTLGLYTSGLLDSAAETLVLAMAVFYGGLVQFIAGFFALRRGDIFPAAFMTSYGAFWLTYAMLNIYIVPRLPAADVAQTTTAYLAVWTVITGIFYAASFFTNWVTVLAFTLLFAAFVVLDIGVGVSNTPITHAGGYLEMALGLTGWYIVAADIVNAMTGSMRLPLPPTPWSAS